MRLALVTALLLLATSSQGFAASGWHRIGGVTQSGAFLVAGAQASAAHPRGLEVRGTATPGGRVGGNVLVDCDGKTLHRHVHGATPLLRVLPLPVAHPGGCHVVVNVTYAARGTVSVGILGR